MILDVVFIRDNTITSRVIRAFTRSEYSHVGILINDTFYQASGMRGGVVKDLYTCTFWEDRSTVEYKIPIKLDEAQRKTLIDLLESQIGTPYDFKAIFSFITDRDWHELNKWFCSELLAWGLEAIGYIEPNESFNRITPKDLQYILERKI